jgi:hypothetical protein
VQACGVVFPLAMPTSICRSIVTICSGLYLCMGMTAFPPSGFSLIPPGTNFAGHVNIKKAKGAVIFASSFPPSRNVNMFCS